MSIESLLESLKSGVTGVTGVQANSDGASGCNTGKPGGVTGVTGAALDRDGGVTPVTPPGSAGVTPKPAPILACTHVTPVTQKKDEPRESDPFRPSQPEHSRPRIIQCGDCAHHIPSAPILRAHGEWDPPGGCTLGLTSPAAWPPIYPCTGWYCSAWRAKAVH